MNNLYVLIGAPGCGKSTWAKEKKVQGWNVISRDEIRLAYLKDGEDFFSHEKETFDIYVNHIVASLLCHPNTIADASHVSEGSRAKLLNAIAARIHPSSYTVIFVYFDTSYATCLRRNALRQGRARVPEDDIYSMFSAQTLPSYNELRRANVAGIEIIHEPLKI